MGGGSSSLKVEEAGVETGDEQIWGEREGEYEPTVSNLMAQNSSEESPCLSQVIHVAMLRNSSRPF